MKIEVKNLEKVFRTDSVETIALNNVSFTVADGDFAAIMLGLLDNPTGGSYMLDGREVANLRESERTAFRKGKIGFVFQSFNLIDEMTVRDNIMLPLNNLNLPKAERIKRVEQAMQRMGISHRGNHYPQQLSGGQQQRVAIARATVSNPGLILADEPTGNLDSKNGAEVMNLLDELHREGATIVMVTHSHADAARADYIINLFDGQVVESLTDKL